jgi:glycosyltransferase involved in cell wall biosynthesis
VNRTLVMMPTLNEEESLPATLKGLREVVDDLEILVIDDGWTDATTKIARRAGAVSAQLPFTLGVGGAVRVGLHYAQRNGYDRAVVIDADGQHDPAGITALLEALDRGADMAIGTASRPAPPTTPWVGPGGRRCGS